MDVEYLYYKWGIDAADLEKIEILGESYKRACQKI